MSKRPSSAKIGGFVIGAVTLVVVVIAVFGSGQFFTDREKYVIYFRSSASGLDVGSPVRLKGVDIGEVRDVTAVFTEGWRFYVEVIIEVDTDAIVNLSGLEETSREATVTALIARGLRAQLETQSMVLGQKYIKMDLFPETGLRYQFLNSKYPEIPAIPAIDEQIGQTVERLVRQIDEVPIAEISGSLLSAVQRLDSLLNSQSFYDLVQELDMTLQETRLAMQKINSEVEPLSANINRAIDALTVTTAAADTLLVSLNTMTVENQSELYLSVKEFRETARAMRNLLDYLQRHPDAPVWGKD
jgi:paraquat-inducible protein B